MQHSMHATSAASTQPGSRQLAHAHSAAARLQHTARSAQLLRPQNHLVRTGSASPSRCLHLSCTLAHPGASQACRSWRTGIAASAAPSFRTQHTCSSTHQPANRSRGQWLPYHVVGHSMRRWAPPCVAMVEPEVLPDVGLFLTPQELDQQRRIMAGLTHTNTYPQLLQWLQMQLQLWESGAASSDPSSVVIALTQKVHELEENFWSTCDQLNDEAVMELQEVREEAASQLLMTVQEILPRLPLDSVAACVHAASEHDEDIYYSEEFFNAVAQRVLDGAQSLEDAAAARSLGPKNSPALLDCRPEALQENLRLLCNAFSQSGHYVPTLMQLLAEEVCASAHTLDAGLMAWIVWNFMELQHYNKDMLNRLGVQLLKPCTDPAQVDMHGGRAPLNIATLTPVASAYVASAFAFFNVQNPAFYQVLLARMSAAQLDDLTFDHAARLFMACQMVPKTVPIPASLSELLEKAALRDMSQTAEFIHTHRAYVAGDMDDEAEIVQLMLRAQDYDSLCLRQLHHVLRAAKLLPEGQSEELWAPVSTQVPWMIPHMCIPGQGMDGRYSNVYVQLLNDDCFCRNTKGRLRGYAQATLHCLQRLDVAVWGLPLVNWVDQVEDAAGAVGLPEDYGEISWLWAQSLSKDGIDDPDLQARLHEMIMELGNYVDTCVRGAITIQQQQQQAAAQLVVNQA